MSTVVNAEHRDAVFLLFNYDRRSPLTLGQLDNFSCDHLVHMIVDELTLLWTWYVWELLYLTSAQLSINPGRRTLDRTKLI